MATIPGMTPEQVADFLARHPQAKVSGPARLPGAAPAASDALASVGWAGGKTEDDAQAEIVKGLRSRGYVVLVTSRRVKRCHGCGAFPKSGIGDGVSKGLADLQVRHPSWPVGHWRTLEVKRPGKRWRWSSPEQRDAYRAGQFYLVQSLEDALRALDAAH